jgi:hypothetical protein
MLHPVQPPILLARKLEPLIKLYCAVPGAARFPRHSPPIGNY